MRYGTLTFILTLILGIIYWLSHRQHTIEVFKTVQKIEDHFLKKTSARSDEARKTASVDSARGPTRAHPQTLEELEALYKTRLRRDVSPRGKVFRLTGQLKLEKGIIESNSQNLANFLYDASTVMGFDHPDQLKHPVQSAGTMGPITTFTQDYEGIPVEGSLVRVHQDAQGNVFMVTSTYLQGVSGINVTYTVSQNEALKLVTSDAIRFDSQQRAPVTTPPLMVVHNFALNSQIDVAWQIGVNQPWLGPIHGASIYFVNAHSSSIFERIETAKQ